MANLKKYLQTKFKDPDFDLNDLPYLMEFASLPQVDDGTGSNTTEDVDFENWELLDLDFNQNTMTLISGGDWQTPTEFKVKLEDDAHFHVIDNSIIYDAPYRDGLSEDQITLLIQ